MLKALIPLLLFAGVASAAPAPISEKDRLALEADLSRLTPGKPQACIRHLEARSSRLYGDTILFKVSRGLVYRNDTQGGCTNRGMQTAIQTNTPSNRLCAGDPATTFDPVAGILTGTCMLGKFTPYRR